MAGVATGLRQVNNFIRRLVMAAKQQKGMPPKKMVKKGC